MPTTAPGPAKPTAPSKSPLGYNGGLTCSIHVSDIRKSIDWYQNVLGFRLLYHAEQIGWCELATEVAHVNVGLGQVEDPRVGGIKLTFGVRDIDAARAQLEAKGVRFDGATRTIPGMVKLATFFDPDGNTLMFYQSLEQAKA
jgi:catechol 2,3-dioxygenase-like lactoylglutathione lyase family enzyme